MAVSAAPAHAADEPPWHAKLWRDMAHALGADRVAQGVLVAGPPGVGKRLFARRVVRALVCHSRQGNQDACGVCPACRQYAAATHPDIARLTPEQQGGTIKVEQVRALSQRLYLTPQYDNGRVAVIEPAQALSISAANSLLKTLEEPPITCHIVLVSDRVSALTATVRSRCQLWRVPPPEPAAARAWLQANGVEPAGLDRDSLRTPLAVVARGQRDYDTLARQWDADLAAILQTHTDVAELASHVSAQARDLWLGWLYRRASALLAAVLGANASDSLPPALRQAATGLTARTLQSWCARVAETARLAHTNADWPLVVESLLLDLHTGQAG